MNKEDKHEHDFETVYTHDSYTESFCGYRCKCGLDFHPEDICDILNELPDEILEKHIPSWKK